MELFRNIFFNTDKVVENTNVRVTYAGKLFKNGSEDVTVHYGFGENWEDAQDVKMQKSELGFQTDIYVKSNTKLNFCFKNSAGEWDNNEGSNYAFKIEKNYYQEENNNIENTIYENNNVQEQNTSLCNVTPTWAELFKTTFNNLAKYVSKLFSGITEKVNQNNK
ncbi:MAG: hypothetical protein J6K42_01620 [Clostridia bacterium]|nr:hypothetical protein [Clostridia bacterium]